MAVSLAPCEEAKMMKIQMLKNRPAPGGTLPCYLAGHTYTLATSDEIAMAQGFIAEGAAAAVGGLVQAEIVPFPELTFEALLARHEALMKGELPPIWDARALDVLGEPFGLDESALKEALAKLGTPSPEAAEVLSKYGIVAVNVATVRKRK
jgi:hypothetical protein